MNGIHDMGGMDGFGPVVPEVDEPVFHADWEARMFAIANTLFGRGQVNLDEFRHAIERIPTARYLDSSYYERWLDAVETLLVEKGLVTREELESRGADPCPPCQPATVPGGAISYAPATARKRARFQVGDKVVARNLNPPGHIRLPRYARGHRGVIHADYGTYVFADTNAHGGPVTNRHVYSVAFEARELWGKDAAGRERVYLDLWEDYLVPDTAARPRKTAKAAKTAPARKRR